jgi:hypothetical protein
MQCRFCNWAGRVYHFEPPPRRSERPEVAMADDATCANHPSKKAVSICEGTGNYICSLCAVDIDGKTYSVQFLDKQGRQHIAKLANELEQTQKRPDRVYLLMIALSLIPLVGLVTIPWAVVAYVQTMLRMQRDRYLSELLSTGRLLMLTLAGVAVLGVNLFYAIGILTV